MGNSIKKTTKKTAEGRLVKKHNKPYIIRTIFAFQFSYYGAQANHDDDNEKATKKISAVHVRYKSLYISLLSSVKKRNNQVRRRLRNVNDDG